MSLCRGLGGGARGGRARGASAVRMAARAASSRKGTALVPVANGTEEMEAVILADVLRRAGMEVSVASVEADKAVRCSRQVTIVADEMIGDVVGESFDLVAVPGGMPGAERLRDSADLASVLANHVGLVGAVCAAPQVVLQGQSLFKGRRMTCHPAFQPMLAGPKDSVGNRVVVDAGLITSQGPGTTFEFALSLVGELLGHEAAAEVGEPMVLPNDAEESLARFGDAGPSAALGTTPSVLVPIANGTEEMEAVILADVLRRAGFRVVIASCEDGILQIEASRMVKIRADCLLEKVLGESFDAILLPGGMPGAERLGGNESLVRMLRDQKKEGRLYDAVCAAPAVALQPNGLMDQIEAATCHPGFMHALASPSEARVVLSQNCLTSRGPGTTFEFALAAIAILSGEESTVAEVAGPMVLPASFDPSRFAEKLGRH